jgi:hypothetical protein
VEKMTRMPKAATGSHLRVPSRHNLPAQDLPQL